MHEKIKNIAGPENGESCSVLTKKSDLGGVTHSATHDIWSNVTVWNYSHENTYITQEWRNLVSCMTGLKKKTENKMKSQQTNKKDSHQHGHKKRFPLKKTKDKNKNMDVWSPLPPNLMTFTTIEQMVKLQLAQRLLNMTDALWPPVWPISQTEWNGESNTALQCSGPNRAKGKTSLACEVQRVHAHLVRTRCKFFQLWRPVSFFPNQWPFFACGKSLFWNIIGERKQIYCLPAHCPR